MPSLVSAMSPRPANLRSADNSVAPCRSSRVTVGLPVDVPQPGAAAVPASGFPPGLAVSLLVTGPSQPS